MFSAQASQVAGAAALYVEDVFSAYTYTGNGGTQTITNGIDLAGKGGLVWIKERDTGSYLQTNYGHGLVDTVRGSSSMLVSNGTAAAVNSGTNLISGFTNTGFSLGGWANSGSNTFASWTFRKAAKFFDVVTYTGDGTSNRAISHALGVAPGLVTVKATSTTGSWITRHTSATGELYLEQTTAQAASFTLITAMGASTFSASGAANTNGVSYVAYVFAHDPSATGIIQCGSFTTDGSGNATVSLGWEPQFAVIKRFDNTGNWVTQDSSRGFPVGSTSGVVLLPNTSGAEAAVSAQFGVCPTATGFTNAPGALLASATYIYLAIRRGPMRTPTSGAQVYNAIARTGTGAAATVTGVGFPPDLVISKARNNAIDPAFYDRLRGPLLSILSSSTGAEASHSSELTSFDMDGASVGGGAWQYVNASGWTYIHHFLRRYPGVFDEVCYTGTGVAGLSLSHNLRVPPEMMIVKTRSGAASWPVYVASLGNNHSLLLDSTGATLGDFWNSTTPTATSFTVGTGAGVNSSGATYVAYLFATLAGISKVGSYTGNGSSQTINCGFSAGARFVLVKRTDNTGDWYVWDSTRGIIATNDPHLSLNTTAAEVTTDDSVDPASSGFIVNQVAGIDINVNAASYIYLAFA